ncbi:MAG: SUMF1/EgtB/PvdO family nonheme iron enzyme [Akkermansiaceae bacterium]|nr:SUMF1/EgtB/PvdO family nonheme iron enzyme [Akkermansiaceae bacterium]
MPNRERPLPNIPDHEVLRKIGGGAYGEVWLARSVTGALRAVKVVWREDFEDERGFEREFEGILKYEPISRNHPGLMNILHVGRSTGDKSFYYYVMELGDDVTSGQDINPVEYEPRTLRADHPQAAGVQWETGECIEVGLRLAEALEDLHQHGLTHRDVKPSNVIFVNGRAKLADIGLVAARGQRTFVGTEGFVPPEGPGSTQADVYSLGKVLYEIATGMDRLHFPELPDSVPDGPDRKRWLELNRIICDICDPRISKRRITTAGQLAEALRRIQRGKRRHSSTAPVWITTLLLAAFSGWAGWELLKDLDWPRRKPTTVVDMKPAIGKVVIASTPEGADVYDESGVLFGTTPTGEIPAAVGTEVVFTLRKKGYEPLELQGTVPPGATDEPYVLSDEMKIFDPPVEGEAWKDHLGTTYQPVGGAHVASHFVTRRVWERFAAEENPPPDQAVFVEVSRNGRPIEVAATTGELAGRFCKWLRAAAIREGYLTEDHEVLARRETSFRSPQLGEAERAADLLPFRPEVRLIPFGRLLVSSDPPGAVVYVNGVEEGTADKPLSVANVKPGTVSLLLILEGYKPFSTTFPMNENGVVEKTVVMEKNQGVVFGRDWENSLGMRFVPLGADLMVSTWETRVSDYGRYVRENGAQAPPAPTFAQTPDEPVVNVSRDDAAGFCTWLTEHERKSERITFSHQYRLPTDAEWSAMAGVTEETDTSPSWRQSRTQPVFPWGVTWPNDAKPGNFADQSAAVVSGMTADRTIPGYDDGFPYTSPVGSFAANELRLFDLAGNVHEWVEDEYSKLSTRRLGVLRGGGWNTYQIERLYVGSRNPVPPDYRDEYYGFRVVLARNVAPVE